MNTTTRPPRRGSPLRVALAVVGLALAGVTGLTALDATPALAGGTFKTTADVNVRNGPSTSNARVTGYSAGTQKYIECQTRGQMVTSGNYRSDIWNKTADGYSSDLYWTTPTYGDFSPGIGVCGTTQPPPSGTPRATGQKLYSNLGGSGQCTWGALDEWYRRTGRAYYPRLYGNAKDWAASARSYGWTVVADAEPESIVVFQPGVQGADRTYGHVGYVTSVQQRSDGRYITFIEMNASAGPGKYNTRTVKDVAGMSYILRP